MIQKVSRLSALIALAAGSLTAAGVMVSSQYHLSVPALVGGSGNTASAHYKVQTGILGQSAAGTAQSSNYQSSAGLETPGVTADPVGAAAANLSGAYVYPNPFKPNSPGRFQADKITFKGLSADVTIRIFAITGKQVAELHKTDTAADDYEWDAVNGDGRKLASGVYLYLMTAPNGDKAKGRFAIIR